MPISITCGSPSRATEFEYHGTVDEGVTLIFESGGNAENGKNCTLAYILWRIIMYSSKLSLELMKNPRSPLLIWLVMQDFTTLNLNRLLTMIALQS